MKRRLFPLVSAILLTMILLCQTSRAENAYVIDSQEAALRSGPNSINRTIAVLPPATEVEVVKKQNGWARVRLTGSGNETKEGWIQSRFLVDLSTKALKDELNSLKGKQSDFDKERADASQREKSLTDKLTKLTTDYEALKSGSTNYLKVKEEYDAIKASLDTAQDTIKALSQENENLKLSQKVKWFTAGALVLLCGWVLGWTTGRQRKKHRSTYYL